MTYEQFYDSSDIKNLSGLDRVALYIDGKFNQTGYAKYFKHIRWYTVYGNPNAEILDYESGNPLYGDVAAVRLWLQQRADQDKRARIYANRSDIAALAASIEDLPHLWHVATLDDVQWTPEDLALNLKTEFGVEIPVNKIWANQWKGGLTAKVDQSSLFREW